MNYLIWFHIHPYSPIFDVCRWTSCLKTVIGALFARIQKQQLQILLDRQVMLTRARRGLLIFGNAATLKQDTKGLISHSCYSAWVCVCGCFKSLAAVCSSSIKMYQDVSSGLRWHVTTYVYLAVICCLWNGHCNFYTQCCHCWGGLVCCTWWHVRELEHCSCWETICMCFFSLF